MSLSPQWLDELRARTTLSTLIGRTTKIQKAGREWKACCPFHNEKTPSFTINDEKGFYHCFGCGAHGDAIRWMTDQLGMGFMDAVKELAAGAGMDVPAPDPRAAQKAEERASLIDVTSAAQRWFMESLQSGDGARARDYLASRGFSTQTINEFGFGYAPDSRTALKSALSQFDEPMLIEAGLRIAVDGRDPYDRFRARLMLPIQDARGRVIAFGGRILDSGASDAPKYLNSPDTPLFDKGRTLYNHHRASAASRKAGRVVVVEGYMDVIALADAGIGEAVAPMGTALTEQQIELLWRMTDVPVLCFDGDAAGQRAAMRAVTRALPLLRPGHSLGIVRLPTGLDPDDVLKRQGRAAMEKLLGEPASLLDTLWAHEQSAAPLNTPEDKAGLKKRLLDHVDQIAHPDIAALYRRELLDRYSAFAFPPRPPRGQQKSRGAAGKGRWQDRNGPAPSSPQSLAALRRYISGSRRDVLASGVLAGLVRYPDQINRHAEALMAMGGHDPALLESVDVLLDAADSLEHGESEAIFDRLGITPGKAVKHFAFLSDDMQPMQAREELAEAVSLLVERPALERALADATERFALNFDEEAFAEQQRLRKRKLAFEQRLGQMASSRADQRVTETSAPGSEPGHDGHELDRSENYGVRSDDR